MLFDSRKHTMLSFLTIILWGTSAVFTRNLHTSIGAYPDGSTLRFLPSGSLKLQKDARAFQRELCRLSYWHQSSFRSSALL